MKFKTITIFLLALIFLVPKNLLYAQNETLDRDLKIMKTILAELFKVESSSEVRFQINSGTLTEKDISAIYQPGYGIIFSVPDVKSNRFMVVRSGDEEKAELFFEYESPLDEGTREVNEQTVENRLRDFLKNYTSAITNVPDEERLMLIYGKSIFRSAAARSFSITGDASLIINDKSPDIAISVGIGDLKEFHQKRIDEQEFNRRIDKESIFDTDDKRTDLVIFSNILTSAFEENESSVLKITRKPEPVYLPGLGVMYGADLRRANTFMAKLRTGNLPEVRVHIDSLRTRIDTDRFDMDSIRFHIDSIRIEQNDIRVMMDSIRKVTQQWDSVYSKEIEKALQEARKQYSDAEKQIRAMYSDNDFSGNFTFTMADSDTIDYKKELRKSLDLVKEIMINYGGTLSSVQPDEMIMVSLNISVRNRDVPDAVHLAIKKEDIRQYQNGDLSRAQAMAKITQREE